MIVVAPVIAVAHWSTVIALIIAAVMPVVVPVSVAHSVPVQAIQVVPLSKLYANSGEPAAVVDALDAYRRV